MISFSDLNEALLAQGSAGPDRGRIPGSVLGLVTTHEVHEFLWNRQVAAASFIALLPHRTVDPLPRFARLPQSNVRTRQTLNDWLAGVAGRGDIANFNVAIAHDCHPLLKSDHNAQPPLKVASARVSRRSPDLVQSRMGDRPLDDREFAVMGAVVRIFGSARAG